MHQELGGNSICYIIEQVLEVENLPLSRMLAGEHHLPVVGVNILKAGLKKQIVISGVIGMSGRREDRKRKSNVMFRGLTDKCKASSSLGKLSDTLV